MPTAGDGSVRGRLFGAELECDRPRLFHRPERIPGVRLRTTSKGAEKIPQATIGIGISKDHLDVHRLPDGAARRFANNAKGFAALTAWLGQQAVARVVYEATGPYHGAFERALGAARFALAKVNPRQARRFAEATGKLAKTDKADAAMPARMGVVLDMPTRPVSSRQQAELKELIVARQALVKDRTAAKNRRAVLSCALLKRHNGERLRQIERQLGAVDIERQLGAVDQAIYALIHGDRDLARRFAVLTSIPGIAKLTAFAFIVDMPELGNLEAKQAASLAGLAPVERQSGRCRGRAFIRGGRASLRQAISMPALVAIRFNADLMAKYQQLTATGKPAKAAITAVMRKLLVLANALLKAGRHWMPKPA